jgi:hypothetical protein
MTGNQELFVREGTFVDFDNLRTLRPQTCISSLMMDIYLRILVASCNKEAGDKKHALYINHVAMSKFQQADKTKPLLFFLGNISTTSLSIDTYLSTLT